MADHSDNARPQIAFAGQRAGRQPTGDFCFCRGGGLCGIVCGRVSISVNKAVLRGHFTAHLVLALGTVIFSWSVVHTAFGLRYAHAFYGDSDQPGERRHAGGLCFP